MLRTHIPNLTDEQARIVREYMLDSKNILADGGNYEFWLRLSRGEATQGDIITFRHELHEIGFIENRYGISGRQLVGQEIDDFFVDYYIPAHSHALKQEYQILVQEVNTVLGLSPDSVPNLSYTDIAYIEQASRRDGFEQMMVTVNNKTDNLLNLQRDGYITFNVNETALITLTPEMQTRLALNQASATILQIVRAVRNRPV
jgi:hypothetical protein